ncbi:galactose oxidase [Gigaspora margarita]|uniref:Galactose oxidase n=1 Tax=Gigaspora margarita TaxID=4874 RepID=A0A8H4A5X7_GIGMA|nr:galactose oxidase [Gigaspora margarita]
MKLALGLLHFLLSVITLLNSINANPVNLNERDQSAGTFEIIGETGVGAMHASLVRPTKMLIIDRAELNTAKTSDGQSALSTEYDLLTNKYRVLNLHTNTFCSAGAFMSNGTLIETGGDVIVGTIGAGIQSLRMYNGCDDLTCDWTEYPNYMTTPRWYNTMVRLPDGRVMNFGGCTKATNKNTKEINNPTIEFFPKTGANDTPVTVQLLLDTMPYNLYPVCIVLPGPVGQNWLFMSANKKAQIWDYVKLEVVKPLPDVPGSPRTYPLTGSATLLPLNYSNNYTAEIILCGGSFDLKPEGAADGTCARMNFGNDNATWETEDFGNPAQPRVMPDGILMPDGKVLFLNGAANGFAGWDTGPTTNRLYSAQNPVKTPFLYDPLANNGSRWTTLTASNIIRVYHSNALLLPDGTVFVSGSNPNSPPCPTCEHPTEYRVERFTPPYLLTGAPRATMKTVAGLTSMNGLNAIEVKFNQIVTIVVDSKVPSDAVFTACLIHHGFVTHSNHMSQRMVILKVESIIPTSTGYAIDVVMPPNSNIMPMGRQTYLYVLSNGVPADTAVEIDLK